jgi:hypothetical protein
MLKVQAVLHDGSVALEFMTDDTVEAEEMRVQFLDFDRAGRGQSSGRAGMVCSVRRIRKHSGRGIPRHGV